MRTSIAFALAAGKLAAAHATFQSFVIDGKNAGQHKGVQTPSNGNNPILDVTSPSMTCNGGSAAADFIEVAAGSKIGLQWHHNDPSDAGGDEPIADSHKGPIMVYVAPAESKGQGDVWVKIQQEGLTGNTWAVTNFIKNKGLIDVTLPNLAPGEYLIRPEIIALHEGNNVGKAQFYNGCGQIKVTGSGSAKLPAGVDLTKAYSAQDPGVHCDIYSGNVACTKDKTPGYEFPGPAVWDGASSGGSAPAPSTPAPSTPAPSTPAPSTPTPSTPATSPEPAQPTPVETGNGSGNGSELPQKFTISEFITWLQSKAGSSVAKRFAREHARDFA